jgi:hypothetical protein
MFISGESTRPLIKESFANVFRKSVRTAGVAADAHPCLPASTRAVDRLGRIAGHAERERYYNVYLRYYFSAGRTPSFPFWFCRRAGFSRGLCEGRRGACAAGRIGFYAMFPAGYGGSYRNSISDIGKLYFKCAAEMSDALPCERKSVHLPRNQNGGIRGGRIEAL